MSSSGILQRYLQTAKKRKAEQDVNKDATKSTEKKSPPKRRKKPSQQPVYSKQKALLAAATVSKNARMDSVYWIPKKDVFNVKTVMQLLTVRPRPDSYNKNPDSFPIFQEQGDLMGVPRFFGINQFGEPGRTCYENAAPMNPDAKTVIELRDTLNYPQVTAAKSWEKRGNGIICLKCGSGKTVVGLYLAVERVKKRTLILVHTEDLMEQWVERIEQFCQNVRVGRLQQKRNDILKSDIVVGMIHSIASQDYEHLDTIGLVIVDEAHHLAARTFCRSIVKIPAEKVLGLSATPDRRDGLFHVVEWLLGGIVFANERHDHRPIEVEQLVYKEGDQKIIEYGPGRLGVPKMISRMTEDMKRNSYIVYLACKAVDMTPNCKMLILSGRLDHLDYLMRMIPDKYTKGYYTGKTSKAERMLSQECEIILGTYNIAAEGLDIPGLNRMILATPSGNTEQVVGRLREDAQHTQRVVYDIVDPFSLFDGMSWKRYKIYKELNYFVRRTPASFDGVPLISTALNPKKPPPRHKKTFRRSQPNSRQSAPPQGVSYLDILAQTAQRQSEQKSSDRGQNQELQPVNSNDVFFF